MEILILLGNVAVCRIRRVSTVVVLLAITVSAGCGGGTPYQPVEEDLRSLGMLYGSFKRDHAGKSATSDQELKDYSKSLPKETLEKLQIDDIDRIFVSPRDGQPYVILYGDAVMKNPGQIIMYERDGQGGKRWILDRMGVATEVDHAIFSQMLNRGP